YGGFFGGCKNVLVNGDEGGECGDRVKSISNDFRGCSGETSFPGGFRGGAGGECMVFE
ncbi:hypothetical protein A2U01_0057656, partial [Trifolium medium]|nr:hypothetical protein [Trifolium medium]